jgi:Malectin domain
VVGAGLAAIGGLAWSSPALAVNTAQNGVVSAHPVSWTPQVTNGAVIAITQIGNRIIAAGNFTTVKQTTTSANITRNRMFAFDATTGAIDMTFNPNFNGSINSIDTDGTYIYAGGSFTTVGGASAPRVAKLTAAGALVPGLPTPNKSVNEVVVRGSRLYIGGAFTTVGGAANTRRALAAVDKNTGALLAQVNVPFTGLYNGGGTNIKRFDVSPDGTKLVAVGNFTTVGGAPRAQLAMLDTPSTGNAAVSTWSTDRYDAAHNPSCASVFDTFMRDVDFAPDGSYFAISATGAYGGGGPQGTLCDTVTRWETTASGNGPQQPTWADYTGGDTTYGVAATGTAIYVGGHMRWENNPFQGDQAGPGAVPREGIAALDPVNGLPLTWNPGRTRGTGAQALYATSAGLWVGSDTAKFAGQTHQRIAFVPLAGGTSIPVVNPATLPNNLFSATRGDATSTGVLYRINAAGGPLQATDNGPDWTSAGSYTSDGNIADWGSTVPVDGTVPPSTPPDIFSAERYGSQSWHLPVPAGKDIQVRLYFANQYDGTAQPGQRVFDVDIDGATALDNFDIVATTGNKRGTMKSFNITSDGSVDIDLIANVENPLINGIEVIDSSVSGSSTSGTLQRQAVDSSGHPTSPATTANTAIDWSTVRGAFLVNGTLYYGLGDGRLYARTFNATTAAVGSQRTVNLYNDPDDGTRIPFAIANSTGMFYDTTLHRLYYTLFNDSNLYYRYFTPESEVVGAQTFTADNAGVDFSTVSGLTLASGRLLYGSTSDGALRSVAFDNGAVDGSPTVLDNSGSWTARAMFVPNN